MSKLINIFKKVSNKIMFSLVIISITSGVNFCATNANKLNNSDDTVLINHTTSDESKTLSKKKDGFFSGMYQIFRNFFSIDERKIYKIIKNLENTTIKKEFEKYEKIHIKTSDDMINYYEKTLNLILDAIKEYSDAVSISSSGNTYAAFKDYLDKVLLVMQLSEQVTPDGDLDNAIEDVRYDIQNMKTLKDFREISEEILDVISDIKNSKKNQNYYKLIYKYNEDTIFKINKCAKYSFNIYDKRKISKKYNGNWILSKTGEHSAYVNYDENENTIFVTFRGTKSYSDLRTDIKFPKEKCGFLNNEGVHGGFLNTYNHFKPELDKKVKEIININQDAKIVFTGHSLGGAIATLAAIDAVNNNEFKDKNISLITFASPRVISEEAYNYSMTNENIKKLYEKTIRIWRAGDIITSMPFEYGLNFKHFGQSWCINKLPDNCSSLQKNIFSWISYSEWIKWYKNLHSMKEIKNDILEIYEDNEEYVDKIKIYKF